MSFECYNVGYLSVRAQYNLKSQEIINPKEISAALKNKPKPRGILFYNEIGFSKKRSWSLCTLSYLFALVCSHEKRKEICINKFHLRSSYRGLCDWINKMGGNFHSLKQYFTKCKFVVDLPDLLIYTSCTCYNNLNVNRYQINIFQIII